MRLPGNRWDPRFSHFRRIENALDHNYVPRVFPVLTTRRLSDRFRNIEASRTHFSLGYVSWIMFGVFWWAGLMLLICYISTGAFFSSTSGVPFRNQEYAYTSEIMESYRAGAQLIGVNGVVLLDPDFDQALPAGLPDLDDEVARLCSRQEIHGVPGKIRIIVHPDPETPYQDVVTEIEAGYRAVHGNPGCDLDVILVSNREAGE